MKFIIPFFLCVTLIKMPVQAQSGCTDPQAINYDASAESNDGSCVYASTTYALTEVTLLPEELPEGSGVQHLGEGLWIHNDGGNENEIYRIDSVNGEVLHSVTITSAENIDWEDITADETHIYIGDFGNNPGNRTDLKIYKVAKADLSNSVVTAEVIAFSYNDQTDFSKNINNNDYDCEAIIYFQDSLHLFTKNWVDNQTRHYVLPTLPGTYNLDYTETLDVEGMITGADISEDNELVLLGYTSGGLNFLWLLFDFEGQLFFSGNKRKIDLGTGLTNSQTEGITFIEDGFGYICSERFNFLPQKLLSFSIKQWVDNLAPFFNLDDSYQISFFPNPFQDFLQIEMSKPIDRWQLYDANGRISKSGITANDDEFRIKVNTVDLVQGSYFFRIEKGSQSKVWKVMKK